MALIDQQRFIIRAHTGRLSLLDELAEVDLGNETGRLGAFQIGTLSDEGFTARAFERYYRGRPAIDGVEFKTFRSPRAAWAAIMRDEIDALYDVSRDAVEFVERDSRNRVYLFLRPYLATLFLNVNAHQFRDKRVRRALNSAVDREQIIKFAYRGRGRVAEGPLLPEHWTLRPTDSLPHYDRADRLSAVSSARSSTRKHGRLRFRCLIVAGLETQPFERMGLMLQKQFWDAGIDMELELVAPREFLRRLAIGDFEAALFEFFARTPSWIYGFWRSPFPGSEVWIRHGYSGADRELDAMHFAETEADLQRAVAAVYRKMAEDPPAIFIAWPEVARAVNKRFEIPVEPGSDIMGANLRLWRPAPRP